jgi:predicted aminopeptidase
VKKALWVASLGLVGTVALIGAACLTAGCSTLGYYTQSVRGHLDLLHRAQPVADVIADANTKTALRERLELSQRIRDFAVRELHLPDNGSYRRYADLGRNAAVWNVAAAPEFSLQLHTWCFAVVGCVGYRGYYDRNAADSEASGLRAQGLEATVYGVPAYSTLGKLEWLGGDPLLNTFIAWPEGELARLIFHELSHQVVFAQGDTMFNESFATAVERIGGTKWLAQSSPAARQEYTRFDARREQFRALVFAWRDKLQMLYASGLPPEAMRERKAELMQQLRAEHERVKTEHWGGSKAYDGWFERANNANFGMLAAYNELVPHFERLYQREGSDLKRFYAAVAQLAALPKDQRHATLRQLN